MDEKARYERGLTQRRKVLGDAYVERSLAARTEFNSEFQEIITRYAWGEIWTRPHFDERTRRILVIGTTLALDKWEEFRLHVRAALVEGGFSADDIKEIILQQMIYCGVPAANHAFREAGEIVKELGKSDAGERPQAKPAQESAIAVSERLAQARFRNSRQRRGGLRRRRSRRQHTDRQREPRGPAFVARPSATREALGSAGRCGARPR